MAAHIFQKMQCFLAQISCPYILPELAPGPRRGKACVRSPWPRLDLWPVSIQKTEWAMPRDSCGQARKHNSAFSWLCLSGANPSGAPSCHVKYLPAWSEPGWRLRGGRRGSAGPGCSETAFVKIITEEVMTVKEVRPHHLHLASNP